MPSGPTTLTRRGWSLLGAALGLIAAGRLLGTSELITLGLAACALIGGCALWTRSRRAPVRLTRQVHPDRVPVGGEARVDLEAHALGPLPQLAVTDTFDEGRRAARFLLPALDPGQRARAAYRVPTDRRGRFVVGPAVLGVADPFGLTVRSVVLTDVAGVIVRPRVHELPGAIGAPGHRRAAQRRARVPTPSMTNDEFLSLRAYEVGDDLRRIHWRSTARLDELIVREDESAWQPQTVLVLDNRSGSHDAPSYEAAIEATASIAWRLGRAGRTIEVLTTAGRRLGGAVGDLRPDTLLDELALLTPDPGDSLLPVGRRLHGGSWRGLLIVVTGTPRDTNAFTGLAGGGAPVTLVLCGSTAGPAATNVTVVDGRPGQLVASWAAIRRPERARRAGVDR